MIQIHAEDRAPFELPSLPYDKSALEPHMSAETFRYHHEKHHNTYVTNLNNLVSGTPFETQTLPEIIANTAGNAEHMGVFNNAAQIWNHTFFWNSMKPSGGGEPSGELLEQISQDFGSFANFAEEFKKAGATQFGSGWAWLVWKGGKLQVMKTANADLPMAHGAEAILTADVWEHAYYIDYRNKRPDYLAVFLENLANWEFAENNFNAARNR